MIVANRGITRRLHARHSLVVMVSVPWLFLLLLRPAYAQTVDTSPSDYIGISSCAASNCHGGVIGRGPAWKSSSSLWLSRDPHARAGLVLQNKRSQEIVNRLLQQPGKEVDPRERNSVLRKRCLSCHVTATPSQCESNEPLSTGFLVGGVSCESCHGAAGTWLDEHYANNFHGVERDASGLRDNDSIVARTQGCVRCHVGSRTVDGMVRDMNHDLIAAGHPVLRFDMASYQRALPQHWSPRPSLDTDDSAIVTRRVGRNITLAAAADLAGERAEAFLQGETVPIPEFSDYDCFACHQSLSVEQFRLPMEANPSAMRVSSGLPLWNAWHTANAALISDVHLQAVAPYRESAAELASAAAVVSEQFVKEALIQAESNHDAATELATVIARLRSEDDWHQAAANYLDLDAALRQLAKQDPRYLVLHQEFVADVAGFLTFRDQFQSPADFTIDTSQAFIDKVKRIAAKHAELKAATQPSSSTQPKLPNGS